jgi:hypothetical protein
MSDVKGLIRAVRGPILLITLGLLFTVDYYGEYSFWRTWPVLMIVYGGFWLLERMVPQGGPDASSGGAA